MALIKDAVFIFDNEEDWFISKETSADLQQSNINRASLDDLFKTRGNLLEQLNLAHCLHLGTGPFAHSLNFPNLHTLILGTNENALRYKVISLQQEAINQLVSSSGALKHLNLSYSTPSSLILDHIQNPSQLKTLNVSGCTIDPSSFNGFIKKASHLTTLDLSQCRDLKKIRFDTLEFPKLETLNLQSSNINIKDLEHILSKAPKLKELNLNHCSNLSGFFENTLKLTHLNTLHLYGSNLDFRSFAKLYSFSNLTSISLSHMIAFQMTLFARHPLIYTSQCEMSTDPRFLCTKILEILQDSDGINFLIALNVIDTVCRTIFPEKKDPYDNISGKKSTQKLHEFYLYARSRYSPSFVDAFFYTIKYCGLESHKIFSSLSTIFSEEQPQSLMDVSSATNRRLPQKGFLDANTDPTLTAGAEYNVTKVFYAHTEAFDPNVAYYRLVTYDTLIINPEPCSSGTAFIRQNAQEDLGLEDVSVASHTEELYALYSLDPTYSSNEYFYGKQTFNLTNQWQSITSLNAVETLVSYHLSDASIIPDIKYRTYEKPAALGQ